MLIWRPRRLRAPAAAGGYDPFSLDDGDAYEVCDTQRPFITGHNRCLLLPSLTWNHSRRFCRLSLTSCSYCFVFVFNVIALNLIGQRFLYFSDSMAQLLEFPYYSMNAKDLHLFGIHRYYAYKFTFLLE